ncbi:MAG: hypothetical protein QXU32_08975 [Nitrososphaerales archaeon]
MCYHQRDGITVFDVPVYYYSVSALACKTIDYGSSAYTDEYMAYAPLKEYGFQHESVCHSDKKYARGGDSFTILNVRTPLVCHSDKKYARGGVHVNNCECRTNLFKLWLCKFMGVNKFNLYNRHLANYEKLMSILSVLIIATIFYIMSESNFYLI